MSFLSYGWFWNHLDKGFLGICCCALSLTCVARLLWNLGVQGLASSGRYQPREKRCSAARVDDRLFIVSCGFNLEGFHLIIGLAVFFSSSSAYLAFDTDLLLGKFCSGSVGYRFLCDRHTISTFIYKFKSLLTLLLSQHLLYICTTTDWNPAWNIFKQSRSTCASVPSLLLNF